MNMLANCPILPFLLILVLATTNGKLIWNRFQDERALCNDYTRSGYFISSMVNYSLSQNNKKWVIFLESGGVCSTPNDCNYRYTNFRAKPFKNSNATVSSLMSSLETFFDDELLAQGMEGYDILSNERYLNPSFHDYIHVLVPYCSSDLWFGQDQNPINTSQFRFSNAHTESFQFTFRGSVIINSLFTELEQRYKLSEASKVVFSGSSAGGIALFTHANTLKSILSPSTELSVLGDSSWFINFQDSFDLINGSVLSKILPAYPACRLLRHGVPCCMSAPCMLTNEEFYPLDLKTLVFFSLYDIYLLNQTLGDQVNSNNVLIFNILRIITEFGGAMNHSLQLVESFSRKKFSFIASSCLQHVFLATSSLWVEGPFGLFAETIQEEYVNSLFSLSVKPGIWTSYTIKLDGNTNSTRYVTIRDAITEWNNGAKISYRDRCKSPHCNPKCPETLTLGLGTPFWPESVQYTLIGVVLTVVIVCVTIKYGLWLWYALIRRNQRRYVERHQKLRAKSDQAHGNTKSFQIMKCEPDDTVTLACLDIEYKVNISALAAKRLRYEEEDIEPLVLKSLDTVNEDMLKTLDRKQMRRRNTFSGKIAHDTSTHDFQAVSPIHVQKECSFSSMGDFPNEDPSTILLQNSPRKSTTMTFEVSPYRKKRLEKDDSMLFETLQRVASFPPEEIKESKFKNPLKQNSRTILKGISALFNPGELVAIMGPSGSGKTTLLDLLTGRRQVGEIKGSVFVNGFNVQAIRSWFIANTGYVLQQAQPFYEELTVRENITLSAFMRLPSSMTLHHKLERIEEVLRETFLIDLGDTKVGRAGGPGLSGGQKRRLSVAVQLLKRPSLLFLDEPTSGLDASSSYELLTYLNHVAASDRTVIVTIHQPRFEIFHLFSKIILLCRGQIAYHGVPEKAYEVFVNAHKSFAYTRGIKLPDIEKHNPADVIMDILGSKESRSAILTYYRLTEESEAICDAICEAQQKRKKYFGPISQQFHGQESSSFFSRIGTWEARASIRVTWSQLLYLPLVFTIYGLLLGSAYKQASEALLIISGFCVYSVASALFMFPIMFTYYQPTLKIYAQERADGAGHAFDLVFHGFVRFVGWAFLPVVSCCAVLYLFIVQYASYDIWVFFQVMIINLALNHTWIALLMFIIFCFPTIAHRISPIVASVAGFAGGFFVPIHLMPIYYKWLFYINPNFYGFSASARIILDNLRLTCPYESELECYTTSANYTLQQFDFINIQPYQHILILICMTIVFLFLAHAALWIRYFNWRQFLKCSKSAKHLDIEDGIDLETYLEGSTEYNPYTIQNNEKRQSTVGQNISNDFHWEIPNETAKQEWQSTKRSAPLANCRSSITSAEQDFGNFIFENIPPTESESSNKNNLSSPNLAISPADSDSKSRSIKISKHKSFKVNRGFEEFQVESELVQSSSLTNLNAPNNTKKQPSLLKSPHEQIRSRQQNMYNRIQEYNLVSKDIDDEVARGKDLTFRKKSSEFYHNTTKKIDNRLLEEMNFLEFESPQKILDPLSRKVSNFHVDGSSTLPTKFESKDDDFEDSFIDPLQKEPVRSFDVLEATEPIGPKLARRKSF